MLNRTIPTVNYSKLNYLETSLVQNTTLECCCFSHTCLLTEEFHEVLLRA